jgi:hypothetical protein
MLPGPIHHVLLMSTLVAAVISDPTAFVKAFLHSDIVRIAVVVIIADTVYAVIQFLRSRRSAPDSSPRDPDLQVETPIEQTA